MEALITDIQRFSVDDGPGIRTTVFFKGCNLGCAWCHNPECIDLLPELQFFRDCCTACGQCVPACPAGARAISPKNDRLEYDRSLCTACGGCAAVCPSGAVSVAGRSITADELLAELEKDRPFYETSGGGVTFSGGEPLLQAGFLAGMLDRCRAAGLSTAVDTAGAVAWQTLESIARRTDLVLYDLKAATAQLHQAVTGMDNRLILANLNRLTEGGFNVRVRVPLIPGVNDSGGELDSIIALLTRLAPSLGAEPLACHDYGRSKYAALDRGYSLAPGLSSATTPASLAAAHPGLFRLDFQDPPSNRPEKATPVRPSALPGSGSGGA